MQVLIISGIPSRGVCGYPAVYPGFPLTALGISGFELLYLTGRQVILVIHKIRVEHSAR